MTFENLERTHGFEPARVEGEVPPDLHGTLLRTGPALFERNGRRIDHPFLCDGAIAGVRFGEGKVERTARWVETEMFRREERAGKFLYRDGGGWLRRFWYGLRGVVKPTGNTSLFVWQRRLYALMEAGRPVELSPETIDTLGERTLANIGQAFSAHPHRVPGRRMTFNFGVRYGRKMEIDIYALPDEGDPRTIGTVAAPWRTLVHDFMATESHFVFHISPAELKPLNAILGIGPLDTWFDWKPQLGSRFAVVSIDRPENVRWVDAPPFWVWHHANAYDDGDDVVLDLCRHDNLGSLGALAGRGKGPVPRLVRYRLHRRGEVDEQEIAPIASEFPTIRPGERATNHTMVWSCTRETTDAGGLARFDVETGTTDRWLPEPGVRATEPLLSDDGRWLLSLVQCEHESYIGVFAPHDVAAGPVAKVWLGQRIPITYHGVWLPRD